MYPILVKDMYFLENNILIAWNVKSLIKTYSILK